MVKENKPRKRGADWLAWSLQFIVGFVVGAFAGLCVLMQSVKHSHGYTPPARDVIILILGAALIGAGLASFFGDRLWIGTSYRIIPPDDFEQSETSRDVSIVIGVLGGCLILRVILQHFAIFSH